MPKVLSFTVSTESFAVVTPAGPAVARRGDQVTIIVAETWEQAAEAVRRRHPGRDG